MPKNYLTFNGGVPTDPEVNDLMEEIGVPRPGDIIPYTRIEAIIKTTRKRARWISVTTAWRKRLDRDHNILLKAVPNEGFEVLDNSGRVNFGGKLYKESLRRMGRAVKVVSTTDRSGLNDDEKRAADHIQKTGAQLRLVAQTAARDLSYPDPEPRATREIAAGA
mgnify:CR=1 FL=1